MIKAAKRAILAILGNADITDEELTHGIYLVMCDTYRYIGISRYRYTRIDILIAQSRKYEGLAFFNLRV